MSAFNFKVKGGGNTKRYLEAMQQAVGGASGVRVGFLEDADYPAGPNSPGQRVAQIAFWNEFGTSTSPARPFFRGTIDRELGDWGAKLGSYLRNNSFDAQRAFELMGTDIKDALTNSIRSWPADNAPSTIARKGFDHGLVEKGIMERAPDYEVLGT